jgi:diguanylate cyclase (GGDEF)-like protein/PAS domain S-box-containing protein
MRPERTRKRSVSEAILESCPDGLFLIDRDRRIRGFNRAMEEITGWKRGQVIGKKCSELFRCRNEKENPVTPSSCAGLSTLNHPGRVCRCELHQRTRSGKEIVIAVAYRSLPASLKNGCPCAVGAVREITAKKRAERALKTQAMTDGLTGLYNIRYFQQQLSREIKRAERYHHPLSLIMLDIDHFKYYNDLHGHLQGNEVLRQMARLILSNTRETNTVARYGGEEFAVLLPETAKEVAVQAAERLCAVIEENVFPFESEQPGGNLTVSLGVASYPEDAHDEDALIRMVDDFLYEAKWSGRNRVRWRDRMEQLK